MGRHGRSGVRADWVGFFVGDKLVKKQAIPAPTVAASFPHLKLPPVFGPSCMRQKLVPRTVRRPSPTPAVRVRLRSTNTKKIEFTQRLPLGSELHMGKERCCLRVVAIAKRSLKHLYNAQVKAPSHSLPRAVKPRHYLLPRQSHVVRDRTDLIKDMLSIPFLKGRIEKWASSCPIRGHASDHNSMANVFRWLSTQGGAGAGLVFFSPNGLLSHHSYRLNFPCTNNVAEYEALLIGLELAAVMGMRSIHVLKGDSQLVVRQVIAEYEVIDAKQQPYTKRALDSIRRV
ncbi:UNVERIFIED_CONTAM: Cytochrome c biogenesis CcmF C-terminal-like mitochondrial protein [Sesamum calycinum]|uniref:Cytochrome c biogenesis CcmF C-terminal-like mitochondrial protein n=1 Tax=Sesamum calycinum TaxID=2727403 RepID=A0AAW2JN18_9LAMI